MTTNVDPRPLSNTFEVIAWRRWTASLKGPEMMSLLTPAGQRKKRNTEGMRTIMLALLMVGTANAKMSREEIDAAIKKALVEHVESVVHETSSCVGLISATMVSARGRAVQEYLRAQEAPQSSFKAGRVAAAREKALRLGGLVRVSQPNGYECRLELGPDKDWVPPQHFR
jgi:hypothetical protein